MNGAEAITIAAIVGIVVIVAIVWGYEVRGTYEKESGQTRMTLTPPTHETTEEDSTDPAVYLESTTQETAVEQEPKLQPKESVQ